MPGCVPCRACGGDQTRGWHLHDDLADFDGGTRGTVADAVDFARECSEEWGVRVTARIEERRENLPPIWKRRADHDGPLWIIRPVIKHGSHCADCYKALDVPPPEPGNFHICRDCHEASQPLRDAIADALRSGGPS